jgi:hypothetical protein
LHDHQWSCCTWTLPRGHATIPLRVGRMRWSDCLPSSLVTLPLLAAKHRVIFCVVYTSPLPLPLDLHPAFPIALHSKSLVGYGKCQRQHPSIPVVILLADGNSHGILKTRSSILSTQLPLQTPKLEHPSRSADRLRWLPTVGRFYASGGPRERMRQPVFAVPIQFPVCFVFSSTV